MAPTAVDPIGKKAKCSKSKMAAAAIMDIKNVSNFHKDEAILTKCLQSTPGTSLYRSVVSDVHILKKFKMTAAAILDIENCQ